MDDELRSIVVSVSHCAFHQKPRKTPMAEPCCIILYYESRFNVLLNKPSSRLVMRIHYSFLSRVGIRDMVQIGLYTASPRNASISTT